MIKKTLIAAAAILSVATFASMPAEAHHNIGLGIGFGFGGYGSCYYGGCGSNIYGRMPFFML